MSISSGYRSKPWRIIANPPIAMNSIGNSSEIYHVAFIKDYDIADLNYSLTSRFDSGLQVRG